MKHKELERWHRLRNIKRASQVLVLAAIAVMVSGYALSRFVKPDPEVFDSPKSVASGSRIDNFSYSSPGPHPWELKALTAEISDNMEKVALAHPKVVYRGGKGGIIYLSAEAGEFDRKSGNVWARGNVVIRYKDMTFTTDAISYSEEKRLAETAAPVSVEGGNIRLKGKGMKLSIIDEEILIERDVKARLFNVRLVEPGQQLPM